MIALNAAKTDYKRSSSHWYTYMCIPQGRYATIGLGSYLFRKAEEDCVIVKVNKTMRNIQLCEKQQRTVPR